MPEQTIEQFVDALAARTPTPGGGATAALSVAQAAALVGMVGRYSDGERFAPHRDAIAAAVASADALRGRALALAADDERAFAAVGAAYALPRGSEEDRSRRRAAIAEALAGAAEPPVQVVTAAGEVVALAARLVPVGNRNLVADLAAAAHAARAGAGIGVVNIEVNLAGITDDGARARCVAAVAAAEEVATAADEVAAAVRAAIAA